MLLLLLVLFSYDLEALMGYSLKKMIKISIV